MGHTKEALVGVPYPVNDVLLNILYLINLTNISSSLVCKLIIFLPKTSAPRKPLIPRAAILQIPISSGGHVCLLISKLCGYARSMTNEYVTKINSTNEATTFLQRDKLLTIERCRLMEIS